jgi:hypothetical protein
MFCIVFCFPNATFTWVSLNNFAIFLVFFDVCKAGIFRLLMLWAPVLLVAFLWHYLFYDVVSTIFFIM